jgi:hypothetical protein
MVINSHDFPDIELQYLISTAYNNGVYYTHLNRFKEAVRWVEMSLNLLPFYTYKATYESDIMETYNMVTEKLKEDDGITAL